MAGNPVLTEHDWETLDSYNPCKHDAAKGRFLKVLEFVREHMKEGWDSSISGEEVWAEVIKFDPHDMKISRHLDCIFRKGFIYPTRWAGLVYGANNGNKSGEDDGENDANNGAPIDDDEGPDPCLGVLA